MTAVPLKKPPVYAPGEGMSQLIHRIPLIAISDAVNLTECSTAGTVTDLFDVPANTLITGIYTYVITASTSSDQACTLGDSDSAARFVADAELQTAGWKRSTTPYLYSSAAKIQSTITLSTGSGAVSQGQVRWLVEYFPNYDQLVKNQRLI